ncbi:PREDICTED: nucleoprotein TPR-like [Priapulus caudatus]|uniref:Nucleoprotein TPR n=1 Tax=Priapulus caudatus TaxID=37621 RepID=A0ABM1DYS1_PRICU|nr:PREDICTED: nucleoprotein TPR-like [Priapulus caudatus]
MENIDLLSSFLDVEELNKIPESIKEKLCMHIEVVQSETKCMKASAALHLANEEQQYLDLEKKFLTTKSQLENEDAECTKLKCKVKDLEEQFTQASSKAKELATSEHDNLSTQLRLSRCNESLEAEKRELSEQLERKNREIDRLNEEWKQMSNKLTTANQRRCEAQAKLDEINSQAISNKFSEERWAQEKKLLEQQVSWLNADGNRKEKELYSLRQETSGKVLQLQMQLDGKSEEAVGLQENVDLLANTNREQEQKLEQLIDKLKESHTTHIKSEEQFQAELHAQTKLAGLYHNSSEEAEGKVLELMTAVHELQKLLKQAAVTHTQLEQKYGEDTRALQASVDDGNGKLDALAKELENANDLLSAARPHGHASMTSEQLEELLPTAATTSKLLKSGMTLTQIYNEYVQTSSALELERLENKRLNQYLEQILQEIEEKAPIVKRWREGYENSLRTIADMTRQHECALQEIDALRCQAIDARRTSGQLERDSARMRQQVADLGQQVQLLLKEVEEARGGRVSVRNESDICDAEISSSSQLISERLVTFRSIGELQEQNQQLLAVVRELSEKQEAEEKRLTDSKTQELQEQLNAATKDLEELRAARQRQADMVESIVRQRDMYRVLLADTSVAPSENGSMITSTPSVPHGQDKELGETKAALSQMQREFDTYKVEKAENTNLLMSQQDKLRVSLSELQIQNAQLSSQFEFTQERYKILQSNVENYKREIAALREKNVKFTANVMLYQQNISTLTQEVTKLQEKLARAETDAENFKAERDILKSVEARLVTERDAVAREQRGQSVLLANLQTLQNNLERSEQETQRRLTNQVENLERECALLRRKHDAEVAHGRAAAKGWDSQVRELRAQLESELRAHQKTREDRSGDTERVASLKSDLCDAEVKLAAAESRLSAAEKPEPARSAAKEELEECHAQLAAAQQEARGVRAQLEQATRSADQYRAIADSVERSLAEQNEASRTLQAVCESRVAEARRASDDLAQRLAATQRQHDAAAQENACLLEQNATQGGTLRRQLVAAQNELAETLAQQKDAAAREGAARDDLTAQAGVAADAQVKYERELVLHAADVQSLTTVREQLDGVMTRARTAEDAAAKADETLSSKQASWEERERALKSECAQLETRSGELQQHNEVLHAQMETMSTQMLAVRARGGSADTSLSDTLDMSIGDDGQKSSEQLLEILRYLRREKEIATTQHEVARADAARQKVRVAQLERQTQELQASIAEERRRGERSARTVGEHAALMEKVEHLNVLVDSNKLLRDEKERATMQAQEQQSRAARLEAELLPVKKSLWEARTLRDALQTESAALRDEVKRWETRTNQLLERSSQVDAEEYRKLVDEKEKQRKQFLALIQEQSGKHKQEREQVDAQAAALTADVARLQASLAAAEKQLAASRSEHSRQSQEVASRQSEEAGTLRKQLAAANARVAKLAQEVAALRGEVADKNQKIQSELKQLNQVRKIGRKYKTQFDELKLEYENYVSQVAGGSRRGGARAGAPRSQQRLEARVQSWRRGGGARRGAARSRRRGAAADRRDRTARKPRAQAEDTVGRDRAALRRSRRIATRLPPRSTTEAAFGPPARTRVQANRRQASTRAGWPKLTQELTEPGGEERERARRPATRANVEQLNRRLETRQKQLSQQQSSKPSASTSTNDRTSSSSEPPTANIKPIATPAAAQKHAAAVTSVSSGSSKAATPTASIRPMAISSQQTPTATVMPTPSSVEFHEEQITGPPTISPTPRQATVQPTQAQAIPAIIITPHVEEEEVIVQVHPPPVEHQEVAQPAEVPVFPLEGIPEHHHHQQQQQQSQPQQQQQQHDQPAVSATEPSRGQTAGKRPREQEIADTTVATEAASEEVPIKRVRAEVETEDSASQGAADEEFTEGELGEAEGELGEAEGELGEAEGNVEN